MDKIIEWNDEMEQLLEKYFLEEYESVSGSKKIFHEDFDSPEISPYLKCINPPADYAQETKFSCLSVRPQESTDFWKTVSKKYSSDSGHFLYADIKGDFTLKAGIRMNPLHRYDQSGLMVRISETCWIKAGYEHDSGGDGGFMVTAANGKYSDWSRSEMNNYKDFVLKITREGNLYTVEYLNKNNIWSTVRMAHLTDDDMVSPVKCGIYAACPEEKGMSVSFDYVTISRLK